MDESRRNSLIDTYYEAIDSEDYAKLDDTFAETGTHNRPGQGTLTGPSEIREFFETKRQSKNTIHDVKRRLHDEQGTLCNVTVSGELPDGPFEGDIIAEFEFNEAEGKISKYQVYRGYQR